MERSASKPQTKTHRGLKVMAIVAQVTITVLIVGSVYVGAALVKGWPLPGPLADLSSKGPMIDENDWCQEHGVPESLCTICDPDRKENREWCAEHEILEELCTLCNPELASRFVMCNEHNLPEAFCTTCNPPVKPAQQEIPDPLEAMMPGQQVAPLPPIRLRGSNTAADAGIQVTAARKTELVDTITCNGQVVYNQNQYAQVRPRVEGIVRAVRVDVGTAVQQGDVLALVDSAQLGEAEAEYLAAIALRELAKKNYDRIQDLTASGIQAEKTRLAAEMRLKETEINTRRTRQALLNLGLSEASLAALLETQNTNSLLPITAPITGQIVQRRAVEGEAVEPTTELFDVAALNTMWLYLDVYEKDVGQIRVGQPVTFTVKNLTSAGFTGKVTWISPEVDPRTRTIRVRADVDNRDGMLRANMFGQGVIRVSSPRQSLVVPKTAVQWYEGFPVAFVRKSDTFFETRRVLLGHQHGALWEVTDGLNPDDLVVTVGSFLFKTELMEGSIGAGCCGD